MFYVVRFAETTAVLQDDYLPHLEWLQNSTEVNAIRLSDGKIFAKYDDGKIRVLLLRQLRKGRSLEDTVQQQGTWSSEAVASQIKDPVAWLNGLAGAIQRPLSRDDIITEIRDMLSCNLIYDNFDLPGCLKELLRKVDEQDVKKK